MSLFDDKNLIDKLVQSANEFEDRFSKKAQITNPTTTPFTPMQNLGDPQGEAAKAAIALKLLDGIEQSMSQVANPELGAAVVTSNKGDAPLTIQHLENLGALIQFLVDNQIMFDYKRIAYSDADKPADESYTLYNVETNPAFAQIGYNSSGFYLNKDLLIKYLTFLQATAHQKQIKVMEVQIGTLIQQANKQLGIKMDPNYKPAQAGKPEEYAGTGTAKSTQDTASQLIGQLINNLPLARDDINFDRMNSFFALYEKLISTDPSKGAAATSSIAGARAAITQAQNFTSEKIFGIMSSNFANEVFYLLKPGSKATAYAPLLGALRQAVTSTAQVVRDFNAAYGQALKGFSEALNKIALQIRPGSGYAFTNTDRLDTLISDAPKVLSGPRR